MHPSFMRVFIALVVLAAAMPMAGCGPSGPKAVKVTGDVTYRGKPLQEANVIFMSKNTRPATSKTDAQGRFAFSTYINSNTEIDEQTVCITKSVPNPQQNKKDLLSDKISVLPKKYSIPTESPLKAPVSAAGPNEFHFELKD